MKISGNKPYVAQTDVKRAREKERISQKEKSEKSASLLDKVEISKEAREKRIREVRGLLDKIPDVREEKVAAVKTAIEDGTYRVKGREIAKKMIKEGIDEFV